MTTRHRSIIIAFAIIAAGCGARGPAGGAGPTGKPGPTGSPGPQGTPGVGAVVWKDATGAPVSGLVGANPFYNSTTGLPWLWIDPSGYVWTVDGNAEAQVVLNDGFDSTFDFGDASCSGIAFLEGARTIPARLTFTVDADPGTVRVRADGAPVETINVCSRGIPGVSCATVSPCVQVQAVRSSNTLPSPALAVPILPFAAPIHPEIP